MYPKEKLPVPRFAKLPQNLGNLQITRKISHFANKKKKSSNSNMLQNKHFNFLLSECLEQEILWVISVVAQKIRVVDSSRVRDLHPHLLQHLPP